MLDILPPTITAPADITVPASSPAGAADVVLGVPVVFDALDPNPTVTNNAPVLFPIGITLVTWTAQDQAGNSASATQQIIVLPLPPGYTDTGSNVSVIPIPGVSLIFSGVSVSGLTTVTTSSNGPALPTQFKLGNPPVYYDLTTTAVYSPPVEVCFSYAGVNYQNENKLRLRHFDGIVWTDITKSGYPDTANKTICGSANSLSPFVITEPSDQMPPTITVPTDLTIETTLVTGAIVTYEALATDNVGIINFACSPNSGSAYPIGSTTVTCAASDAEGNSAAASFTITVKYVPPLFLTVKIDIKPGSFPNPINLKSNGKIPVAILSNATFNALAQINKISLTFGKTGDEKSLSHCDANGEDVNNDGLLDLVCHFQTQQTNFGAGDTEGKLKGKTITIMPLFGRDLIQISPK